MDSDVVVSHRYSGSAIWCGHSRSISTLRNSPLRYAIAVLVWSPPTSDASPLRGSWLHQCLRTACGGCIRMGTTQEQHVEAPVGGRVRLPDSVEELRELERQVEREWWWLHGALNAVAQMHAERAGGTLKNFR